MIRFLATLLFPPSRPEPSNSAEQAQFVADLAQLDRDTRLGDAAMQYAPSRIAVAPAAVKPGKPTGPLPAAPDASSEGRQIARSLLLAVVDSIECDIRVMRCTGLPEVVLEAHRTAADFVGNAAARLAVKA